MSKLFNRAKMTTTTTGTGDLTLGSAVDGFVTFATAGVVNGDKVRYCIEAENGTDFEVGQGTYTASGTVLSRADADVQLSSNSNNRITLAAGTHNVFITAADSDFTQEITVTVAGGKFVIDGTSQQIITLLPSITYRLDQSDSTNASHPLVLASGSADGSTYSTGVRTVGTPGSSGAYTEVKLEQDAPALWYKCSSHSGMGSSVNMGAPSGGVTSVANESAMLALSNPSLGDMVFRTDTLKLMMHNGSGWYVISTLNTAPTISSVSQTTDGVTSALSGGGTYLLNSSNNNTVITVNGADAEAGTTLTYSYALTNSTSLGGTATVSQSGNVFTINPSTDTAGSFQLTFTVSDGISTATFVQNFSLSFGVSLDYLVLAGGGGGGVSLGGGGGAGGLIYQQNQLLSYGTTYTITVGAGGTASTSSSSGATNGADSSIAGSGLTTITAVGGGRGGTRNPAGGSTNPSVGGSGGGGAYTLSGAAGTTNQGFSGGNGVSSGSPYTGGGGGGSSAAGQAGATVGTTGGNGGDGTAVSITGSSVTYAGGGGGAGHDGVSGSNGGSGGAGGGGAGVKTGNATSGTANTGGGGGAARASSGVSGGAGGSGIVIIRTTVTASATSGSPTVTTDGSYNIYKFTASGTIAFAS